MAIQYEAVGYTAPFLYKHKAFKSDQENLQTISN